MNESDIGPSKAHWLAKHMEADIRTRGLRASEPYLTTTQAGQKFGVSKAMAYRAMKILVAREVLVSHPGRGTFIGPQITSAPAEHVKCIHLLLTRDVFQSSGRSSYGWLAGLLASLPGYNIQFDFFPSHDAKVYVKHLIEDGIARGTLSAVCLLGCPQGVQEQVLQSGVPAIVLGTDYSSTRQLPSVDADQFEAGRLATQYLLERGHRRIALLMWEMWLPGDRRMFEGVGQALDKAGLGHEALMLRNLSQETTVLHADLHRLLTAENRPTGCICRSPFFAQSIIQAAESVGLSIPDDLELVCDSPDRLTAASLQVPCVCMKMGVEEQVAVGGRMLAQLFTGRQPDPLHVIMPVELVEPIGQPRVRRSMSGSAE
jgi:DNA-binding LacI/PurR family transcriptional regulator